MENVVMGLLILQSLTLYELNRAFKQGISMFYSASYGSLQAAVKNLLKKGLIAFDEQVEKGRNKKVYRITSRGQEAFQEWMLAETPTSKLEVTALSKVYFLGLVPGIEPKKRILTDILAKIQLAETQLRDLQVALSQLDVPSAYRDVFAFQLVTLDYGIKSHAFARQWFLTLLNDLEAAPGKT